MTGVWFVWGWGDGLVVRAVFDDELTAFRYAQEKGYGQEKVSWVEFGQEFEAAVKP